MGTLKQTAKRIAAVLSALIMFEVLIMISPFALYWYSLYSPTLQALHRWSGTAWLECFVLPHSVITTSAVLEAFRWVIGPYLFSVGLLGFLVLAGQIYTAKFRHKGLVTGGLYRHIRHPQYLCLGLAGLGLLVHWPRMIILVLYLLMMVAYYFLARSEERRLLAAYPDYAAYMQRTAMLLPGNPGGRLFRALFGRIRNHGLAQGLAATGIFAIGIAVGFALRAYTIASADTVTIPEVNIVAIAGWPQGPEKLDRLTRRMLEEPSLRARLAAEGAGSFTAHWLPADYGMMNMFTDLDGTRPALTLERLLRYGKLLLSFLLPFLAPDVKVRLMGHPTGQYRVVVSRVDGPGGVPLALDRVTDAEAKMTAVAVVEVDEASHQVTKMILDPPRRSVWGDIMMPMF
jgi:protein-S-isoprenylcysteine O-methyltransferase Ste14